VAKTCSIESTLRKCFIPPVTCRRHVFIECSLLVGYSHNDRVMDPRGALKLYEKTVNSPQREMVDGVGHGEKRFDRRTYIADWFMKQLGAG
jgi:hypothetical protein